LIDFFKKKLIKSHRQKIGEKPNLWRLGSVVF